jgi:Uma2 family endonuclease
MGFALQHHKFTEDEYLGLDRASQERYTYLDGDIFMMAGESDAHGDASGNVYATLHAQLKGTPCRARQGNARVRSGPVPKPYQSLEGLYSYPDVVVICGEVQHLDEHMDVIANPRVIVEVLSPSTEVFDRGTKFERYKKYNPTLTDYVLVAQGRPLVEHHRRGKDGRWSVRTYKGLDASFRIASIGCTLALADVYDRVAFPPES